MKSNDINTERVIDLSYLNSLSDGDREFKKEMIETFLKNTPPLISEMKDHLQKSDWKKIGDIAHKMKPSFTFMGIHSAKDLIRNLECNGRKETGTRDIPTQVIELDNICSKAFIELHDEMET
jgi:HPt (histidine-containing phosphotransfer) domain-containing protein